MNNRSIEYCAMKIDPFEEVEYYDMLGNDDMLIVFKDGKKYIYDLVKQIPRRIWYENADGLSDAEWLYEFKIRLSQIMNRKFISQKELASRIGTSEVMISRYVNGHAIPSARMLDRIITALNSSYDELFYFKHF